MFGQNSADFRNCFRMPVNITVAGGNRDFTINVFAMSAPETDHSVCPVSGRPSIADADDVVVANVLWNVGVANQRQDRRLLR